MPKSNKTPGGNAAVKTPIEGYDGLFSLKVVRRDHEADRRNLETIIREAERPKPEAPAK